MKFSHLLIIAAAMATIGAQAAETPLWLRHPAISPDGKEVAFDYRGDIYVVNSEGGQARQLTSAAAYDAYPVWSPDGTKIAFASDRDGSLDIFVVASQGGTPQRVTTNSTNETPRAWADNSTVIYSTNLQPDRKAAQGAFMGQTYAADITGKTRPKMLYSLPMSAIDVNPRDGRILYQDKKSYEDELRKHERSSGTADVWLIDENGTFKQLTTFNGHDLSPRWISDSEIAYISEEDGTLNVYSRSIDGRNKKQLTKMSTHPVRDLTVAENGTMAFSWNGELYTLAPGAEPKLMDITIIADDYDRDLNRSRVNSGAATMAVSPDGEQVAFTVRGDLYVTSTKYKTTRRITNTPAQERVASFGADGKSIIYDSDRDGQWKLYMAKIDDKDKETFPYATSVTETLLYASPEGFAAQQPIVSPDGKKVAFLEDRAEIKVLDLETKKAVEALDKKYNYSYSDGDIGFTWSPDSRWLLTSYIGVNGWNKEDIALVKADGTEVVNLTESGYSNYNPRWAMGGKALTYSTGKYGMRSHGSWGEQGDVMVMFLDGDAWEEFNMTEEEAELAKKGKDDAEKSENENKDSGKKSKKDKKNESKKDDETKPLKFDLDNRNYRHRRLTAISTSLGDYFLSTDGTKLYYVAGAPDGSYNLMEHDLRKGNTATLVAGLAGGIEPDAKGENLFFITSQGMKKLNLSSSKTEEIEFDAPLDLRPSAEREYIFDHMLAQVNDKFYDENLHGVDWKGYGEAYRRFLPHINNNYDFANLLSEILGELNASHTGGRYYAPGAKFSTANLGVFFDEDYQGTGLKIAEIIARGPLANPSAKATAGDIIMAIDGTEITQGTDINPLLDGKAGRPVVLSIKHHDGTTTQSTVRPISQGTLSGLLYQRWVERNEALVDSLSDGRLGYVHVRGMDSPSFREVYSRLLGRHRNKEAVIVDTRYNGGGWLHNDVAQLLNGEQYSTFAPRGQVIGTDPINQWTKPSVMLVNEANYSDAYGTPYVYQTLKIGDIVGAPVPGTMTAVWWETQIDPTLIFGIPEVTNLNQEGKALENVQLNPEVLVINRPDRVIEGIDDQIATAVKHLLQKLDATK